MSSERKYEMCGFIVISDLKNSRKENYAAKNKQQNNMRTLKKTCQNGVFSFRPSESLIVTPIH